MTANQKQGIDPKLISLFVLNCVREARQCGLGPIGLELLLLAHCREGDAINKLEICSRLLVLIEHVEESIKETSSFIDLEYIDDDLFRLRITDKGRELIDHIIGF